MTMTELVRTIQVLEEAGLTDTQIKNALKFIESGDREYISAMKPALAPNPDQ